MDFEHSERAQTFIGHVERFVRERVVPNERTYFEQLVRTDDWRRWRIPPIMETLKGEARAAGLWNLFLPDSEHGAGLDNRDYAPLAEIMGRSFLAPEVFNCSAPDTGRARRHPGRLCSGARALSIMSPMTITAPPTATGIVTRSPTNTTAVTTAKSGAVHDTAPVSVGPS